MKLALSTDTYGSQDHSWLGSARGLQYAQKATLAVAAFTAGTHYPNGYFPDGTALALATSGTYSGKYVPLAARPNEVKTVTVTGTPTGGTFTLTLDGETTGTIAYNAAAAAVLAALEALSNVQPGDVAVTGSAGGPYTLTFGGARAGIDVPDMTATATGLTGGTSPGVTLATTTAGGSGVTTGADVLAGFLAFPIAVRATDTVVHGALLDHGRIITAKLPVALSATQRATNTQFVWA